MMEFFDGINHPTSAQVRAAGCSGCLMYCGTPGDSLGKDFTAAQYADYRANGIVRILVYENLANDIAGGASGGAAHAAAFLADARAKGVDIHDPAVATVDEHVAAASLPLAVAYQSGFYHALKANGWLGPVGIYGFSEVLIACHNAGVADWYWGAGARSAMPPYTNVWQDNTGVITIGGSVDDRDWILVPLPGGTMDWSDPLPNPIYDPAITDPGDERSHKTYTALQFIQGPWVRTLNLPTTDAAILAAVQGVDSDVKAGVVKLASAIAAVPAGQPPTDAQVQAIEAAIIKALPGYTVNIVRTAGGTP
jgi:hypothetical protein